ncbi:MAG: GFA family protein [Alphaproteobacteria bacterium]|nr:GFA family protein [Alphaproteobacteria bacterium]
MTKKLEGGCACGAIRYRLATSPMFVHCCHCRDCQRQTGSAFAINAIIETDRIKLLKGKPKPFTVPTDSQRPHDIYRCAKCQTALWSDYGRRLVMSFLRVGTLDNAAACPPDVHIFTRSKLAWIELPKSARAFKIYYNMEKEWPPESWARRKALLG